MKCLYVNFQKECSIFSIFCSELIFPKHIKKPFLYTKECKKHYNVLSGDKKASQQQKKTKVCIWQKVQ